MTAESLLMSTYGDGTTAVIELDGEFDLHGAETFGLTVAELLERRPAALEIDASNVTFIDSAGLQALLVACRHASEHDVDLRITKTSEPVDRLVGMTGVHEMLGVAH